MDTLDPATTALLAIDLQQGILQLPLAPHASADLVSRTAQIASRFRGAGAPVFFTSVGWSPDFRDALQPPVDRPIQGPTPGPDWADMPPALGVAPGDFRLMKRQWGAFYGTELDLQLRRRGIKTLVLTGIATNLGVESTARQAWELGYGLVFVEDAISSLSPEMHAFAVNVIFPMIGRVRSTEQVLGMV